RGRGILTDIGPDGRWRVHHPGCITRIRASSFHPQRARDAAGARTPGRRRAMRAVVIERFGGPEVLQVVDLPDPHAGQGQVRVAVHAAGTNPVDASNRSDGSWAGIDLPHVPGYDVAGVVDQVGKGVDAVSVGQRVMAMTP